MEEMDATLNALQKKTLMPQIYNNQEEIEKACQKGKIFGFKTHIFFLIFIIIALFTGIGCVLIGFYLILRGFWYNDVWTVANIAFNCGFGVFVIVKSMKFWKVKRTKLSPHRTRWCFL